MNKFWLNKEYKLDSSIILADLIVEKYLNLFWKEIVFSLKDKQYFLFITRVKYTNGHISTIGNMQKINKKSKDEIIKYIKNILTLSFETYKNNPITSIIFSYGFREGDINSKVILREDQAKATARATESNKYHIYYNNKLPLALIPEEYGLILSSNNNIFTIITDSNATIILNQIKDGDKVKNIIKYFKDKKLLFSWIDTIISLENKKFIREIGKSILHYENDELILYSIIKKTKPIVKKQIPKNYQLDNKFITMDLETVNINNTLIPYLLCWFDGKIKESYFITSPLELQDLSTLSKDELDQYILRMFSLAIKDICIRKYKGYKIYLHNFSKFDGYFLIKHLSQLGKVEPIIHKGRIISTKFIKFESKYNITFMDSYLILPSSLKKLSDTFNIQIPKGIFPFNLNNINYQGRVPDMQYFNNITLFEYNTYKKQFYGKIWKFRDESIKYCNLDCIILFKVITEFNKLIFNLFNINIRKFLTLPALSINIFNYRYLKENTIHNLSGEISNDIRKGYTGGAVDMYLTTPLNNKQIYAYDVNSLYPHVMALNKFPIGNPTYFEGDITKYKPNAFGFFYCKIFCNSNLKHPILQTHINTNNGLRTIAPLGSWEGMYFSEELYNAQRYGYKFEIKWGYTFNSDYLFKDFVKDIYNLRLTYPKTDPMNFTAKLLLNSLYGRFGMVYNFIQNKIINKNEYLDFERDNMNSILDVINLESNYLIKINNPQRELDNYLNNGNSKDNVNIAIASAVTAYARIHMTHFKNNKDLPNLYYTDTDSAYFDGPLPDSVISENELGKLKLEGIYPDAVFLAPKVYALKNKEGEIVKIKGLSKESIITNNINIETLKYLLDEDTKSEFLQNKWNRNIDKGNITLLEQLYTLKITTNKRNLVYNENNKLIGTYPFSLKNGKF